MLLLLLLLLLLRREMHAVFWMSQAIVQHDHIVNKTTNKQLPSLEVFIRFRNVKYMWHLLWPIASLVGSNITTLAGSKCDELPGNRSDCLCRMFFFFFIALSPVNWISRLGHRLPCHAAAHLSTTATTIDILIQLSVLCLVSPRNIFQMRPLGNCCPIHFLSRAIKCLNQTLVLSDLVLCKFL